MVTTGGSRGNRHAAADESLSAIVRRVQVAGQAFVQDGELVAMSETLLPVAVEISGQGVSQWTCRLLYRRPLQ